VKDSNQLLLINCRLRFRLSVKRKGKIQVHLRRFGLYVFGAYRILNFANRPIISIKRHALRKNININSYVYLARFAQKIDPVLFYTISIYLIDSTIDTMHRNAVPQI